MCQSVCFGVISIDELSDFRKWFEVLPEDFEPGYNDLDGCLCGTKVEAVLQRAGLRYHVDVFGDVIVDATPPSRFLYGDRLR